MEFIHGDILDKDLVNRYFKNADIVHHLAGITDVPRTKSESSGDLDEKIKLVGEKGTQNILDVYLLLIYTFLDTYVNKSFCQKMS